MEPTLIFNSVPGRVNNSYTPLIINDGVSMTGSASGPASKDVIKIKNTRINRRMGYKIISNDNIKNKKEVQYTYIS
jgi:hypothetical protein